MEDLLKNLRSNDLPNWITFAFTAIIWPLVIIVWSKFPRGLIHFFDINLSQGNITINGNKVPSINITFNNNSDKVIYIKNISLTYNHKNLKISQHTGRNLNRECELLLFNTSSNMYDLKKYIFDTSSSNFTALGVENSPNGIIDYKPSFFRKIFKIKKYFNLKFIAMVGNKKVNVLITH
jgi:hypothetical protein